MSNPKIVHLTNTTMTILWYILKRVAGERHVPTFDSKIEN